MSSKPKLHDDILILIVEKIFFQKPEGDGNNTIDLRKGNPYTFFMALKPITETAFITQFAKLRRVEFQQNAEDETIEFHKDEEKSAVVNQNGLFTGPWRVSNMQLEKIVMRKKFRVTNVATREYLKNREACELGPNATSLEAFCALFLDKELDIADSMMNDYDLAIKKLEIHECSEDIKKNFEAIHAINSKELLLDANFYDFFSVCCSSLPRSQITADKTIKITIESGVDEDETSKFVCNPMMNYANFVIETCPNLTTLHFDVVNFYSARDYTDEAEQLNTATDFLDTLNAVLRSFMTEFLKPLDKGHSELKLCLTLIGICQLRYNDEAILQDHELFTIGTEFTTEHPIWGTMDIARIIKETDANGREHECILKMIIEWID